MNQWFGIGNLGSDPTLRSTASGRSVLNFSIAVDRMVRTPSTDGGTGTVKRVPDWIPVVVFGDAADHQAKYLQKGTKVAVTGSLRPRTYTDKQNIEHHTFEVQADRIDWLGNVRSPDAVADEDTVG